MCAIDATGEADDAATGVHVPIGSTETGERGDEVDAVGVGDGLGEFVAAGSLVDHLQFIAQPLDGGAAVEGGAFEAVGDVVVRQRPGDTGDEVALGLDSLFAGVHEQEAAGTIGGLDDAVLERALTEESGGLVADGAGDRSACETFEAGDTGRDETVDLAGGDDLRQDAHGDAHEFAELFIPGQGVDVEEHGAGGVGIVRDVDCAFRMDSAAGQVPDEPGVDGAEEEFALVRKFLCFGDVVEKPADLGGGEVGVDDEAGLLFDGLEMSLCLQFLGIVRGAAALPDDGVVDGTTGRFIPKDGGLTLVGDTDGGDVGGVDLAFAEDGGDALEFGHEDVFRTMFYPACMRIDLLELSLGFGDDLAILVKNDRSGTGGTLIQSHYIFGHSKVPPL